MYTFVPCSLRVSSRKWHDLAGRNMDVVRKATDSSQASLLAADIYRGRGFIVPAMSVVNEYEVEIEYVRGRPLLPGDVGTVAKVLAGVERSLWADHRARAVPHFDN